MYIYKDICMYMNVYVCMYGPDLSLASASRPPVDLLQSLPTILMSDLDSRDTIPCAKSLWG